MSSCQVCGRMHGSKQPAICERLTRQGKLLAQAENDVAALIAQRDKLLVMIKVALKQNPFRWCSGDDDAGECIYCKGVNCHRTDCAYVAAQAAIAEVEAQMKEEGNE